MSAIEVPASRAPIRNPGITMVEQVVAVVFLIISVKMVFFAHAKQVRQDEIEGALTELSAYAIRMEVAHKRSSSYGTEQCGSHLPARRKTFSFTCAVTRQGTAFTAYANGVDALNGYVSTVDQSGRRNTPRFRGIPPPAPAPDCWLERLDSCYRTNKLM